MAQDNTSSIHDIVIPMLRKLQSDVTELKAHADRTDTRLFAIEQHLATSLASSAAERNSLDQLHRRVERIERRLELVDDDPAP